VQKPGVGSLLKADLAFVSFAAKFLEFVNPDLARLSLADIMVLPAATALRGEGRGVSD
jgi:predicted unusual protein kinase regulating ubiquinone biosynthesis (AarF/ABC1/UbiB family)